MNQLDLKNIIFEVCSKNNFPADVRDLFVSLKNNPLLINALGNKFNEYQSFHKDLLYDLILQTYLKERKVFIPFFKYEIDDAIYNTNLPRLCLNLHSNFSPLTSILIKKSCPFVVVSDYPNTVKRIAINSGIRSANIKIFSNNEACLLHTKNFLNKNYVVSSTIDFKSKMPGKYNLLSDGMLRLALFLRPVVFFGINFVNDAGELVYMTKAVNLDNNLDKIKTDILKFIVTYKINSQFEFGKFDYLKQKKELFHFLNSGKHQ